MIAGLTPGVARVVRGRDRGAYVDRDRSDEILAALGGAGAPPAAPVPPAATTRSAADFSALLPNRIAEVWRDHGGRAGALGAPASAPFDMHESGWAGRGVRFEQGAVFAWDPPRDSVPARPFVVLSTEPALTRWVELGAGQSVLGWPIGPVGLGPDGSTRMLWCTRGVVFDRGEQGVFSLFGSLFPVWQSHARDLGLPVSDATVSDDPRAPQSMRFERGRLFWSAERGAWRE